LGKKLHENSGSLLANTHHVEGVGKKGLTYDSCCCKSYAWVVDVVRHKRARVAQGGWDRKERLRADRCLERTELVL
jgi:hypothetical protein